MNINVCIDHVSALLITSSHLTLYNYFHMDCERAALVCHLKQDKWAGGSYACTFVRRLHKAHTLSRLGSLQRLCWFPAAWDQIHLFDFLMCNTRCQLLRPRHCGLILLWWIQWKTGSYSSVNVDVMKHQTLLFTGELNTLALTLLTY